MRLSNLPPGVTAGMLPGNTAADAAYEQLCDALGDIVPNATEAEIDALADFVMNRCDSAWHNGYTRGACE